MIEPAAGTGKTTRLVKGGLEALLVREIPLDKLFALTELKFGGSMGKAK